MPSVVPATDAEKPVVARLIQLYLHDMTEQLPFPVGADGLFAYDYLERFWQHPYLIRLNDEIAGFALVIDECPVTGRHPCWFMAEFFVLRGYRGKRVGRGAFAQIEALHPGAWHVASIERNQPATAFWDRVLAARPDLTVTRLQFDGEEWVLRAFRSGTGQA